ncbi:MAG TPA: tetratricopeptide repeat protein [Bellilinea sp.]
MVDPILELEVHLASASELQDKIETINTLALKLRYRDVSRAISLTKQVQQLEAGEAASDPLYIRGLAESLRNLGALHTQVGDYEEALRVLLEALELYEQIEDRRDRITVYAQIGAVYLYLSSFVNALQYTLKGLELARLSEERELEGALLNNLATIYILRQEHSRALPYLLKTLQIAESAGDMRTQAEALDNICNVYCRLESPEEALAAGEKSLMLYRELGESQGEAEVLNTLGTVYQAAHEYQRALECYSGALVLSRKIALRYETIGALLHIASVKADQNQMEEALKTLKQGLELAEEIGAKGRLVEVHQSLSSVYNKSGQFQRALFHYESFHQIKEQVFNDEAETRLKNLEVVYQVEAARRDAEIEQLKNVALKQEIHERFQAQQALLAANQQLQVEIEEREQLIQDLNAFAHMVAHDLKTPLQSLAILSFMLESVLTKLEGADEALNLTGEIRQTGQKANSIIMELLTLASLRSRDVEPTDLQMELVVAEAIKRVSFLLENSGARLTVADEWPAVRGHGPWIEEVWVNLISNAVRYGGKPPVVQAGGEVLPGRMTRFWVRDNGIGIAPADQGKLFQDFSRLNTTQAAGHGLGLSIVRRIIEKLGGEVGVISSGVDGEGSEFWFTLPA